MSARDRRTEAPPPAEDGHRAIRGAFSISEPGLGSDVAAIRTRARRDGNGGYVIDGQKMWLTNGASSTLVAVLVRTDEEPTNAHRNLTAFLVEKPSGFGEVVEGLSIPGRIDKLGYKGVDTTELIFDGYRASDDQVLGGHPGRGFIHMMDGVEVGRVNVAARACGVGIRAFSSPFVMHSSGPLSAGRSPSIRRSHSGWPRWRPKSKRPI